VKATKKKVKNAKAKSKAVKAKPNKKKAKKAAKKIAKKVAASLSAGRCYTKAGDSSTVSIWEGGFKVGEMSEAAAKASGIPPCG
jgi:hypothetical protein